MVVVRAKVREGLADVAAQMDVMVDHRISRKFRFDVRYDPFDAGSAFAFVQNRWAECHSEYYAIFQGRSEREVMLASHELRKRRQNHTQRFPVTARRLAEFLESVEAEEKLLVQRLGDMEVRRVRSGLGTTSERALQKPLMDLRGDSGTTEAATTPAEEPLQACQTYGEL